MPEEAEVRARHMKSLLAAVDALAARGQAIRARIRPEELEIVAQASGADWLPLGCNVSLTRAVHAEIGQRAFEAFFREHTLRSFEGPLLGPLVKALVRMVGVDPASWAGWLPRAWGFIFRGCGTWAVEQTGKGRVRAWLERSPPICVLDEVWIPSVAACLGALVDVNHAVGGVEVISIDRASGVAVFEMRWRVPKDH
jgi:hypothetical protein